MNLNGGYVKLFRKTLDSRVFANDGLLKVWIWCLLKASHKTEWVTMKTGSGSTEVQVNPGQFVYGRKAAAKELRAPQGSVRNRIEKLKNIGNLAIQPDTHYSIITIINWDTYQQQPEKEDRQEDNHRTTTGQPEDTYKNAKNPKNKKKTDMSFSLKENAEIVLAKINELSGKSFRNTKPIEAVMRSKAVKATLEDCLKVVEFKWQDEFIREKYFTPDSLFRIEKFQAKLDEANNSKIPTAAGRAVLTQKDVEDLIS